MRKSELRANTSVRNKMLTNDKWQAMIDLANRTTFLTAIETGLMSVIILVSALGNTASCIIMYRNPRLRNWHNLFLLNVMITDLLCAVLCFPFIIAVLVTGTWPLGHNLCQVTAFAASTLLAVSITTLAAISISRYLFVKRILLYLTVFKKRNVVCMICAIWGFALLTAFPPFVGWGHFTFLPGNAMCFIHFRDGLSYGAVFTLLVIGVPFVIISVCFVKVCLMLRRQKVLTKTGAVLPSGSTNSISLTEINTAKSLLSLVVVVSLCWLPMVFLILFVAFGHREIPRQVSLASTFLVSLSFAVKPFVYFIMKKEYRTELRKLFCRKVLSLKTDRQVCPS